MRPFIHADFLLSSDASVRLYHDYAASEPIIDYHCHLAPADLARNRRFADLHEIWLEGDHYKWRAMRANGVEERLCTGDAPSREKFMAWARTVPDTLRNPVYHWSHLELKRYFGIDGLLDESAAEGVWDRTMELLRGDDLSVWGILEKFDVRAICTTDDPADSLDHHETIAAHNEAGRMGTRVYPTFRPDGIQLIGNAPAFNAWVDRLGSSANTDVSSFSAFVGALESRHAAFDSIGCRLSDHGMAVCFSDFCSTDEAAAVFDRARRGEQVSSGDAGRFCSFMMEEFGRMDASRGWVKQLHLGAYRNVNTRRIAELGRDTGFDSIGDCPQAEALGRYLDRLERSGSLPKMILYNLNPADNYVFAAMTGNFQGSLAAGKIQYGAGWWFLDQLQGMRWQIDALSNNGLLSRFVGMLTDSRSFMSFPRHEYFRRLLCDLLGREMEAGLLPSDFDLVGSLVRRVCYSNAREYLGIEVSASE